MVPLPGDDGQRGDFLGFVSTFVRGPVSRLRAVTGRVPVPSAAGAAISRCRTGQTGSSGQQQQEAAETKCEAPGGHHVKLQWWR